MRPVRPLRWLAAWLGLGLLILAGLFLAACTTDGETRERIDWNLSDSLRNYSSVVITLVDPHDSTLVRDTVHAGNLADPKGLESYAVDPDLGGNYRIVIRGYDAQGQLAFESRIDVASGKAQAPVKTPQDRLPAFQPKPAGPGLLAVLDVSGGALVPDFRPDIFAYAVEVPFGVLQMAVHAVTDSASTLTLGSKPLVSGDISDPVDLAVGRTNLTVAVKGPAGSLKSYVIAVTRQAGNTVRLRELTLSAGSLAPAFHPDSLEYAVTLPAEVETLVVSAVADDPLAKVTAGSETLDSALGKVVVLDTGATASLEITVRGQDSSASVTYRLDMKRALSADAALSSLLLTGSELSPEFHPDTLVYSASTAQAQVAVLPTARHMGAKIKVGAFAVASGSLSPVLLSPGEGGSLNLPVEVTAADGTKRAYTLRVTRITLGGKLTGIALSANRGTFPVALDSAFKVDRLAYQATVARSIDTLVIAVTVNGSPFELEPPKILLNGAACVIRNTNTAGGVTTFVCSAPLLLGMNLARVEADGVTYTFRVLRDLSKETGLAQLVVSAGVLRPAFNAAVTSYTDTVPHAAAALRVTVVPKDTLARVIVRLKRRVPILRKVGADPGDTISIRLPYATLAVDTPQPGVPSRDLSLAVGHNLVEVTVVAEDTTVKKVYSVSVERRASANARLSGLVVNTMASKVPLKLNPDFAPTTLSYSGFTSAAFVTVTPRAGETGQAILVNGKAVATGTASQSLTLANGANSIKVEVTAPDKLSKVTYTLSITKTFFFTPLEK